MKVTVSDLALMTRGWFVGNFSPTVLSSDLFEVAVKRYRSGDVEPRHYHDIATEITVIIEGKVQVNGVVYSRDTIITIPPGVDAEFKALSDVITVVVKTPCLQKDKFIGIKNA
jgi:quercetin dioxygenase-like cupin family protein